MRRSFRAKAIGLVVLAGTPALVLALLLAWLVDASIFTLSLLAFVGSMLLAYCAYALGELIDSQLRSLSNLVDALVNGDYSLRGRRGSGDDMLDELVGQLNRLSQELQSKRYEVTERQHLLDTIMNQIDVALLTVNGRNIITLANPAACRLLASEGEGLVGMKITQWLASGWLMPGTDEVHELAAARVRVVVDGFRERGEQHRVVMLANVHQLLRHQQLEAWRDLVRVLSHEINNSLAPIASISQSLQGVLEKETLQRPGPVQEGLALIGDRADSLRQFVDRYRQLARLPKIRPEKSLLKPVFERISMMYPERAFSILVTEDASVFCDAVQMEQVWINLVKNADEAMDGNALPLTIEVTEDRREVLVTVIDSGVGLAGTENLFVPFFTTKPGGSGVGLALCRQIVEAHGGSIVVTNRGDGEKGCVATVRLPTGADAVAPFRASPLSGNSSASSACGKGSRGPIG